MPINNYEIEKVNALLFDLGGVLLKVDWMKVFVEWSTYSQFSAIEIADRFCMDVAYQRHERGQLSASEYFSYLRDIVAYQGDEATFIQGWNSIFDGWIDEAVSILASIDSEMPLYLFTNTNVTHELEWRLGSSMLLKRFKKVFVSSTMGCRKPELKAFQKVIEEINIDAGEVLFFDDTKENVDGAKRAGLQAVHATGPEDIRNALIKCGVL